MSFPICVSENGQELTVYYPNTEDHQYHYVQHNRRLFEFHYLEYMRHVGTRIGARCIYDIGVCFANHSVFFGKVMNAEVICFEPNSQLHELIEQTLKTNHVDYRLFKVALSDQADTGELALCDSNVGASRVVESNANEGAVEGIPIQIESLDSVIANNNIPIPQIIKIDTEGHEIKVLNGASELLREHHPDLFVEVDPENRSTVFEMMNKLGYRLIVRIGKNYHFSTGYSNAEGRALRFKALRCKAAKEWKKLWHGKH